MYPRRPKVEAFSNTVDVVERLRDPTDPRNERMVPSRSAHVQLGDVPRTLDPVEGRGRVSSARRRGDGDGCDPCRASPKHYVNMTGGANCGERDAAHGLEQLLCLQGVPYPRI